MNISSIDLTSTPSLGLAVTHLNASVGDALSIAQLECALQQGSISAVGESSIAAALISQLFIELNPCLIVLCAYEAGVDARSANMLYEEGLRNHMPRVAEWEQSTAFLV